MRSPVLSRLSLVAGLGPLVFVPACSSGEPGPSEGCEGRAQPFTPGMIQPSEDDSVVVELIAAEPAPPASADALWTLRLSDATGEPLEGASLVAIPYMPDHGHSAPARVGEETDAGVYELGPLGLTMPGLWDVALRIAPASGEPTEAGFMFCIGG